MRRMCVFPLKSFHIEDIKWFIPLDYAVSLASAFLDAYAMYIVWKYFRKVLSALLGSGGNIAKLISLIVS